MNVSMPVAGSTGDFQDKGAAPNVLFPESALAEFSENRGEELKHVRKIWLVRNGEGEEFYAVSLREFGALDDPIKAAPHP